MVDPNKYGVIPDSKRKRVKIEFPIRYSKELSGMVYFEMTGGGASHGSMRGKVLYRKYWGVHLSSFRLVEVLVPHSLEGELERKNYVVFRNRIHRSGVVVLKAKDLEGDRIVWILDQEKLKKVTGKDWTIPRRLLMRLKTLNLKWKSPPETVREVAGCSFCGLLTIPKLERGERGLKLIVIPGDDPRLPSIIKHLSDRYLVFKHEDKCTAVFETPYTLNYIYQALRSISEMYPLSRLSKTKEIY